MSCSVAGSITTKQISQLQVDDSYIIVRPKLTDLKTLNK